MQSDIQQELGAGLGMEASITGGSAEAELMRLRAENARLLDRQSNIMELIGTSDPNRILHDIRNILNERELLRALADLGD